MRDIYTLRIGGEGEIGAARRAVHRFAESLGFGADRLAELDIVVQEIGTNAARYADGGGCLHWMRALDAEPGLELCYWDKGPGIADMDRAVRDGVSSSGSLGGGLGAIRRLMDEFEIYSTVRGTTRRLSRSRRTAHGTAILCRKWVETRADASTETGAHPLSQRLGVWSRPRPREEVNGDAYFIATHKRQTLFAVVDGLGHGYGAHQASQVALGTLEEWRGEPLDEVFLAAHDALRATRGAVMGACIVDYESESLYYAGVGNVEVRVFNALERIHPVPNNGTLGVRLSAVRLWRHPWSAGAIIVMATDGLSASWDILAYPGLLKKSPQLVAGVLLRDYGRESDDATVLVAR